MNTRRMERADLEVGVVGFGAWAIGGDWGDVSEDDAMAALHGAVDAGTTFIDTADVYGDGRSEQLVGRLLRERDEPLVVATKMGRRASVALEQATLENFTAWTDRSRTNLGVDTLDLVQLHCLGFEPLYEPRVLEALETLRERGAIAQYGVSIERVEEGLKAMDWPGLASIQVIYNPLRQRPAKLLVPEAIRREVGIIVRVPLASGLLTGKLGPDVRFAEDDHRSFNRHGEAFDVGETFAGVPYDLGLQAVEELRPLVPEGQTMAQFTLRWILSDPGVTVVIPGAKNPAQAQANAAAADLEPLEDEQIEAVAEIYDRLVAPAVHQRW